VARGQPLSAVGRDVDLVLITVPDDEIAQVASTIEPGDAVLVHVSGAKSLEVLRPHRRVASVHPLISLPNAEIGAARLTAGATFAVAGDPVATTIVGALGGQAIEVADDARAIYHAAASVAANHLVALCGQVERLAIAAGVPPSAYWQLMALTLDNVQGSGAAAALTGPAARGDLTTIAAHLAAIEPTERQLYLTLCDAAGFLAGRSRPLSEELSPDPPP
jgi:predicted short-subunit dehydrogenase-like oxidoreductase (DUF2520 family)